MAITIRGVVSSTKGDKTIVVTSTRRKTHPIYKKQYTVNTRFMAHDPKNEAKVGDEVIISESRPLSARKRFILSQITEKGGARFEEADAIADIPQEEASEPQAESKKPEPKIEKKVAKKTADKPKTKEQSKEPA
jgi:small subunit ribosomal protein S17